MRLARLDARDPGAGIGVAGIGHDRAHVRARADAPSRRAPGAAFTWFVVKVPAADRRLRRIDQREIRAAPVLVGLDPAIERCPPESRRARSLRRRFRYKTWSDGNRRCDRAGEQPLAAKMKSEFSCRNDDASNPPAIFGACRVLTSPRDFRAAPSLPASRTSGSATASPDPRRLSPDCPPRCSRIAARCADRAARRDPGNSCTSRSSYPAAPFSPEQPHERRAAHSPPANARAISASRHARPRASRRSSCECRDSPGSRCGVKLIVTVAPGGDAQVPARSPRDAGVSGRRKRARSRCTPRKGSRSSPCAPRRSPRSCWKRRCSSGSSKPPPQQRAQAAE